jgi:hypothetical protein
MALPETRSLTRVALWLALAYAVLLAGPYFYAAFLLGESDLLGGVLLAATWTAAPVYAAAAFVGASPSRTGARFFLALELALIASFAWGFVGSLHSATGGLIFFTWPLAQWTALVLAFLLALAFGWRMRPDFLKD